MMKVVLRGSFRRCFYKQIYFFLVEMVGANGMMMSAEEWFDDGNYEIKGNAFPRIALKSP